MEARALIDAQYFWATGARSIAVPIGETEDRMSNRGMLRSKGMRRLITALAASAIVLMLAVAPVAAHNHTDTTNTAVLIDRPTPPTTTVS